MAWERSGVQIPLGPPVIIKFLQMAKNIHDNKIDDKIDDKVKLYFFDLDRKVGDYIQFYQRTQSGLYAKYSTHLYSPLYLALKDARYCFGGEVGSKLPSRISSDAVTFAGVLLIDIAFRIVLSVFFDLRSLRKKNHEYTTKEKFIEFAERYMNIKGEELKLLRCLRNSLNHYDYSTRWESNDGEKVIKFKLTDHPTGNKIILVKHLNPSVTECLVNPLELASSFEIAAQSYKKFLLKKVNKEARDRFYDNVNVEKWMGYT